MDADERDAVLAMKYPAFGRWLKSWLLARANNGPTNDEEVDRDFPEVAHLTAMAWSTFETKGEPDELVQRFRAAPHVIRVLAWSRMTRSIYERQDVYAYAKWVHKHVGALIVECFVESEVKQ